MTFSVLERAWSTYRMMHPEASAERRAQLEEFIQRSAERRHEQLLTLSLTYLMKLDLRES